MSEDFKRPHGTTANPDWANATCPTDLVPTTDDKHGRGKRMVQMVSAFKLTQGQYAGRRLGDGVLLPWQTDLVRYIFGETDSKGNRKVRRVGLIIGKGSGKTSLAAAIATAFVIDSAQRNVNRRGLVLIVAAGIASANIAFQAIHEGVVADEHLAGQFRTYTARRALRHLETGIEIRVISPDMQAAVGLRPVLLIADEIHIAAEENKDFADVIDQLRRGGANAGHEFLEIGVTTSPTARSVGFYASWSAEMRAIRDGKKKDDSTLPVLFTWPTSRPELDIRDESQWWRGMPSLSINGSAGTMDAGQMKRELEEAAADEGGRSLELLLSQRLGIEPEERKVSGKASIGEAWANVPVLHGQPRAPQKLTVAFDPAAGVDDPFAIACASVDADGVVLFRVRQFLLMEGYARQNKNERVFYDKAIACGELKLFERYQQMEAAIIEQASAWLQSSEGGTAFGGDRFGMSGFVQRLENHIGLGFVDVSQGWKLAGSKNELEALIASGAVEREENSPMLQWNWNNLVIDSSGPTEKFRKADAGMSGQGARKIDGCMALLSSVDLLSKVTEISISSMIG